MSELFGVTRRHVIIEGGCVTLEGYIAADADLDGVIELEEFGTGQNLQVAGWMMDSIEDVDAGQDKYRPGEFVAWAGPPLSKDRENG